MQKNSLDIFIPYWGDPQLLKIAIQSVFKQTNKNWHLTVVDDCYPDKMAEKFCKNIQDKRFSYIRNKNNLGITNNFNKCLKLAKSKYILFMGCDDELLPHYVERALTSIGDADFYQPSVGVINSEGKNSLPISDLVKKIIQPKKSGIYQGEKLASSLCKGNWLYFPSIMWKKEVVSKYGFNNDLSIVQDVYLELSIIKDGGSVYFDREVSFNYRRHSKSLSSLSKKSDGKRFTEEEEVYNNFAKIFQRIGWPQASRNARYHVTSRLHRLMSKSF